MPFIQKDFYLHTPIKATLFLKQLGYPPHLAQKIIDKKRLKHNNIPVKKSQILQGLVRLTYFEERFYQANELIEPFFITKDFACFNKPPKLLIHPKGSFLHKSLLDSMMFYFDSHTKPIHRLDYETSGIVLAGRGYANERALKDMFMAKQVQKLYIAKIRGHLSESITIQAPIKEPTKADKLARKNLCIRSQIHPQGKLATTIVIPIAYHGDCTFVKVIPLTGRTHQIRLHLWYSGYPIVNDFLYSDDDAQSMRYLDEIKASFQSYSHKFAPNPHIEQNPALNDLYADKFLCLHAYALRFCFKGITYHICTTQSLHVLNWWDYDLDLAQVGSF
ncbi:RluA family pseudouridine synthase [uncultured Helicobacter sp.]|uniref:pseudouridine synthase family protein n=1 Tax=uncultured Helicobacter sp. TaxID=175537 RepID=UPI0027DDAB1D|nr:RluA family pseudouridine synthase [uncultured Helicobacter sp.]